MTVRTARLAIAVVVLMSFAATACTGAARPVASLAPAQTRSSEEGQVTVTVSWPGAAAGPVFDVVLDTHAVDLDGYDLARLAVLRTDDGREVPAATWSAGLGGHHRAGKLVFPATGPDGQPVLGSGTHALELVIRDVAGVPERSFRWTL